MLGIIKDWSNSTLTPFLCSNFCYGSSLIPLIYLNERKFVVLMLNCSFLLPTSFRIWQNFCEATISNIMPLIVNELNLAPVYYSWQRDTPRDLWTHGCIFLSLSLFIQFLLRSRSFPRQRIELCIRLLRRVPWHIYTFWHIQIILLTKIFCGDVCIMYNCALRPHRLSLRNTILFL